YAYFNVSTYTSNLISLDLLIYVSPNTVSVCSILPILRVCRRIRYLHAIIKHEIPSENNNLNVSIRELFINENDLPISPKLTSFDISIFTTCDTRSIAYILRCMPNLLHFKFLHESREVAWPSAYDLVNEYPKLDLDMVVNSFQYFAQKYPECQRFTGACYVTHDWLS
ncbi:unnamed protein product, partial [Rotaria magnacalcarata]